MSKTIEIETISFACGCKVIPVGTTGVHWKQEHCEAHTASSNAAAERDRLRAVNAKLLEACRVTVSGRMSDRSTLIAARKLCRDAIAAEEAAEAE